MHKVSDSIYLNTGWCSIVFVGFFVSHFAISVCPVSLPSWSLCRSACGVCHVHTILFLCLHPPSFSWSFRMCQLQWVLWYFSPLSNFHFIWRTFIAVDIIIVFSVLFEILMQCFFLGLWWKQCTAFLWTLGWKIKERSICMKIFIALKLQRLQIWISWLDSLLDNLFICFGHCAIIMHWYPHGYWFCSLFGKLLSLCLWVWFH
jgi:hypothetical protein